MLWHIPCEAGDVCARAWGGMSVEFNWGWIDSSEGAEKANKCLITHKIPSLQWHAKPWATNWRSSEVKYKKPIVEQKKKRMNDDSGQVNWPMGLKLKRRGSSRPLGRRVLGWRSSSKKACAHASRGDSLVTGVYSSSREQRAMASGGVRGLNTWQKREI